MVFLTRHRVEPAPALRTSVRTMSSPRRLVGSERSLCTVCMMSVNVTFWIYTSVGSEFHPFMDTWRVLRHFLKNSLYYRSFIDFVHRRRNICLTAAFLVSWNKNRQKAAFVSSQTAGMPNFPTDCLHSAELKLDVYPLWILNIYQSR